MQHWNQVKKKLSDLQVPNPSDAARDRAVELSWIAFQNSSKEEVQQHRRFFEFHLRSFALGGTLSAAAVLIIVLTFLKPSTPLSSLDNTGRSILAQGQAEFPGLLKAVVFGENGSDIQLRDNPSSLPSQPIVIELRKGSEVIRVVTFSGERLSLKLGNSTYTLDVVEAGQGNKGNVIISGDNFIWSPEQDSQPLGYKIKAQVL